METTLPIVPDDRNHVILRAGLVLTRRHPVSGLLVLPTADEISTAIAPIASENIGRFVVVSASTGMPRDAAAGWQFVSLLRLQADLPADLSDEIANTILMAA